MAGISLVLGGNGFLGHYITRELVYNGEVVRCIERRTPRTEDVLSGVEYIIGDAFDGAFLKSNMRDVSTVYYFISTSMPNSGEKNLGKEIEVTLKSLDNLLSIMVQLGVRNIVYPSSGGAIYGNQLGQRVSEDVLLKPTTPYGVGKQLSEEILKYYSLNYSINANVFRVGNVYGSKQLRDKPQGAVDVFVQSTLKNEPIKIWGDATKSIRDYIYLEDAAAAIVQTSLLRLSGFNIFNIGTGIGTSIQELINIIEKKMDRKVKIEFQPQKTSGVNGIILDCSRIHKTTGWMPKVDIESGIEFTINAKKRALGLA